MLNYMQTYANNILKAGYNVFLTGDAGTGKTYVLKDFLNEARESGYNVMALTPTGLASINIQGCTIYDGLKIKPNDVYRYLVKKDETVINEAIELLFHTDILAIDEISTCRVDLFDIISNVILLANNKRKRYNKPCIQLILTGDFFQLPPVITEQDKLYLDNHYNRDIENGYAFMSKFWSLFNFKYIILTEIVRQDNKEFITKLNDIRLGRKESLHEIYNKASKVEINGAITIYGRTKDVYNKNLIELDKIPGVTTLYEADIEGDIMERNMVADKNLLLKPGARVMTIINKDGYCNGSFGIVEQTLIDTVIIRFDNGQVIEIEPCEWEVYSYRVTNNILERYKVGSYKQLPIKLGYAITIHKSQGQTYDKLNLSPDCWDCGQMYVALSRVKDIKDLYFYNKPNEQDLIISLNVIKFYNSIVHEANSEIDKSKNPRKEFKVGVGSVNTREARSTTSSKASSTTDSTAGGETGSVNTREARSTTDSTASSTTDSTAGGETGSTNADLNFLLSALSNI